MKKIKLLSIVILSVIVYSCTSNEMINPEPNETSEIIDSDLARIKEAGIKTYWSIGRKSRNCEGFGICKLKKVVGYVKFRTNIQNRKQQDLSNNRETDLEAYVVASEFPDEFYFFVDSENLALIKNYFGKESLILDEDFILTKQETLELELKDNFVMKIGTYNFTYDESTGLYQTVIVNKN
jgi:hypothetical protein